MVCQTVIGCQHIFPICDQGRVCPSGSVGSERARHNLFLLIWLSSLAQAWATYTTENPEIQRKRKTGTRKRNIDLRCRYSVYFLILAYFPPIV